MISLDIQARDSKNSLKKLRESGFMPAVFYGKKEPSKAVSVSLKEFTKVRQKAGETAVITLKQKGAEDLEALLQEVDLNPITNVPRHADFYVFEKGKTLKIKVPVEFVGVSPAIKELGGILVKVLHDIQIESLPKDFPQKITVDISSLVDFKSQILAKDVPLPAGVALSEKPDEVVASIYEPKEEVETAPEPVDLSAIEVEKKGKEVPEGEAGAAPASAEKAPEAKPAEKGKGEKK